MRSKRIRTLKRVNRTASMNYVENRGNTKASKIDRFAQNLSCQRLPDFYSYISSSREWPSPSLWPIALHIANHREFVELSFQEDSFSTLPWKSTNVLWPSDAKLIEQVHWRNQSLSEFWPVSRWVNWFSDAAASMRLTLWLMTQDMVPTETRQRPTVSPI